MCAMVCVRWQRLRTSHSYAHKASGGSTKDEHPSICVGILREFAPQSQGRARARRARSCLSTNTYEATWARNENSPLSKTPNDEIKPAAAEQSPPSTTPRPDRASQLYIPSSSYLVSCVGASRRGLQLVELRCHHAVEQSLLGGFGVNHLGLEEELALAVVLQLVPLALPHEAVRALRHDVGAGGGVLYILFRAQQRRPHVAACRFSGRMDECCCTGWLVCSLTPNGGGGLLSLHSSCPPASSVFNCGTALAQLCLTPCNDDAGSHRGQTIAGGYQGWGRSHGRRRRRRSREARRRLPGRDSEAREKQGQQEESHGESQVNC